MRKDLLAVVLLCLALTSGVASKSKSSLSKDEISQAVTSLLTDVRKAKSVSDYIGSLQNYEAFKRDHKSSGICFPAAPYLENPSSQPDPNQAHKRCTGGYKLGERLWEKMGEDRGQGWQVACGGHGQPQMPAFRGEPCLSRYSTDLHVQGSQTRLQSVAPEVHQSPFHG
jgi:hypothetical protein